MIRVVLESPFGMDPARFIPYGRACVAHSLSLGEAPMAMHLLYTQPGVLDDGKMAERVKGMEAAFAWYGVAERCVVYRDFGLSRGMEDGIALAISLGLPVDYRSIRGAQFTAAVKRPYPDVQFAPEIEQDAYTPPGLTRYRPPD